MSEKLSAVFQEVLQISKERLNMKTDISIIIPIYKGQQFIPYWLKKIENNLTHISSLHLRSELILVNDFPEEQIKMEDLQTGELSLKVLNSKVNRGIHGARTYGLEHAEGEWVVFLDQDDWITDDYLLKQKLCIKDADAVICNGYIKKTCMDTSRFIYTDYEKQKSVKDLATYIKDGNPIYSPGQVMLKREAIPCPWYQHKLKMNGADDYYLWILMLKEGKRFVLNEEKLYTHVGHGNNASNDIASMLKSTREVEQILIADHMLSDEEKEVILNRKPLEAERLKYADMIAVYDYWLYLEKRKQSVAGFLREHGYSKIGIYGMAGIGNRLYDFLSDSDIETIFAIDRRAKTFTCSIPVFCLEDTQVEGYMKQADAIIVTAETAFDAIKAEIEKKYVIPVLSFKSILLEMITAMENYV